LAIQRQSLGEEHPTIARTLSHLAITAEAQDKFQEAEELHVKALEILVRTEGDCTANVANTLMNLAVAESKQGFYEKAEEHLKNSLNICCQIFEADHPKVAEVFKHLGNLFLDRESFDEAQQNFNNALDIFRKYEHTAIDQAFVIGQLADLFGRKGELEKQQLAYDDALSLYNDKIGKNNQMFVELLERIGRFHVDQKDFQQASLVYKELVAVGRPMLGESHPLVKSAVDSLERCYDEIEGDETDIIDDYDDDAFSEEELSETEVDTDKKLEESEEEEEEEEETPPQVIIEPAQPEEPSLPEADKSINTDTPVTPPELETKGPPPVEPTVHRPTTPVVQPPSQEIDYTSSSWNIPWVPVAIGVVGVVVGFMYYKRTLRR